jgi:hypothetical protein
MFMIQRQLKHVAWAMALGAFAIAQSGGSLAAEFTVRYTAGDILPGQSAGIQFLDWIELTNNGEFIFGGDTTAVTTADEFMYTGTFDPFTVTLQAQEGTSDGGVPAATFGSFDGAVDMNTNGDFVYMSNVNGNTLDTVYVNNVKFVREGEMLAGEIVNGLAHTQIDGTGTPWFIADIGADAATDQALFHGTTLIFREGDVLVTSNGPLTINTIIISESTSGCKLRVNDRGDYIIAVDVDPLNNPDDVVVFNGEVLFGQGEDFMGLGPIGFIDQLGITTSGRWWAQLEVVGFGEVLVLENTTLAKTGDSLGGILTIRNFQVADVNDHGDWIATGFLDGAPSVDSDRVMIFNGQIIGREGDPLDANFNWGGSIGFINDLKLNDNGDFMFIALLVPTAGGTSESLVTGTTQGTDDCEPCGDLDGDGDVDMDDYEAFRGAYGRTSDDPAYLVCADFDGSGAVGLSDFQAWLACFRAASEAPSALHVSTRPSSEFGGAADAVEVDLSRTEIGSVDGDVVNEMLPESP